MNRHSNSNRVQIYVVELLVLKLRKFEIRILELEKELAAAHVPKTYCSTLVQADVEIAFPKPPKISKRVQTDRDDPPPLPTFGPTPPTSTNPPHCSKKSKLVQVELEFSKPSHSSLGVQCTLLTPDLQVAKAEVKKRVEEKRGSVNVKVQTVTLEDRVVHSEQPVEHRVEDRGVETEQLIEPHGAEDDKTKIEEAAEEARRDFKLYPNS